MSTPEHVNAGDELNPDQYNSLVDAVERQIDGTYGSSSKTESVTGVPDPPLVELYEVTSAATYDDSAKEWSCQGVPIVGQWCSVDGDGHATGSVGPGGGNARYRQAMVGDTVSGTSFVAETIYITCTPRSDTTNQEADPDKVPVNVGDRLNTVVRAGKRESIGLGEIGPFPFELYGDIMPGGAALYWPLKANLTRDDTINPPTDTKVTDGILGDVRAYGSHHSGFTTGAKGWYIISGDGNKQIVSIKRLSRMISGAGPSTAVATGDTFTLGASGTLTALDDGQLPVPATGGSGLTGVQNNGQAIPKNMSAVVVYADGSGGYQTLPPSVATVISGHLGSAITSGTASFPLGTTTVIQPGPGAVMPTSDSQVYNVFQWAADGGALYWAMWNAGATTPRWEAFQIMCPAP